MPTLHSSPRSSRRGCGVVRIWLSKLVIMVSAGSGLVLTSNAAPELPEEDAVASDSLFATPDTADEGSFQRTTRLQFPTGGLPFDNLFGAFRATPQALPSLVPGRLVFEQLNEGLSVSLGTSPTYNTNMFQSSVDEVSGATLASDLGLAYRHGDWKRLGLFLGVDYNLGYYHYFDEELREGREPVEQDFSGFIGLKGVKTTLTLSIALAETNGNSLNQGRLERETANRSSNRYDLNLRANRSLARGSLSAGLGCSLEEFDEEEEGLTDLTDWNANIGWSHSPIRAPKTSFRLGTGFGRSEQTGGVEEESISPSVGLTYRYNAKTTFSANAGFSYRESSGATQSSATPSTVVAGVPPAPGTVAPPPPPPSATASSSFTTTNPTYGLGAAWTPTETTALGISLSRRTQASALEGQSSSDTTALTLTASKQFGNGYYASVDYSLEDSTYTDSSGNETNSEPGAGSPGIIDRYHRFGLTVGRGFQLGPRVSLQTSAFYQLNIGEGEGPLSGYEQNIVGLRLGLNF